MISSRKRYVQHLAAQRFYEEATGDYGFYQEDAYEFTEAELREEAAFRCWLREIDLHDCPLMLPSNAALRGLADAWDWLYGPLLWWSWPVLSTCARCSRNADMLCADCQCLLRYCFMSEAWTESAH